MQYVSKCLVWRTENSIINIIHFKNWSIVVTTHNGVCRSVGQVTLELSSRHKNKNQYKL
jgi:hypothetical protein